MNRETLVPAIPDLRGDNLKDVVAALKSTLDVREGRVGDPMDQLVTLRDLVDIGALTGGGSSVLTSGARVPVTVPGVGPGGYDPATDFTTPPAPTGLVATAGFTNVYLEWDGAPYRNHAYTEIWRAQTDSLGQAVRVGTTAASVYADPANTGTTYYYWIRFVSLADVAGPYNATAGVRVDTPVPVGYLLEQLAGQITESQLYTTLGQRINLIDAPASTNGSVNYRLSQEVAARVAALTAEANARSAAIQVEANARADAILAESQARAAAIGAETILRGEAISAERVLREAADAAEAATRAQAVAAEAAARAQAIDDEAQIRATALLQEAQTRLAAIQTEETVRQGADSSLASQISTLTASLTTQGSTFNAAIQDEATARADAVSAEAVQRETLATQLRGNYNGSDLSQVSSGLIYSERASRVSADSALQSQISVLSSTVTTNQSTLSAAIVEESTARASALSAEASERQTLATQLRGNYTGEDAAQITSGLIYSERTSRITADESLQTQINTLVAASSGEFGDLMAAIQEEQTARVAGDTANASNISTLSARLNNVKDKNGNVTNKSLEATLVDDRVARVDGDSALSTAISTLSATVSDNATTTSSAIQDEATARALADSAEVTARESLATQLRGNYDGTTPSLLASGLLYNERQARVSAEQAIASSVSLLSATVDNNLNQVNSAISSESQARATAVSAEAYERSQLATQIRGNYTGSDLSQVTTGLIYSERSSRIANDQVLQSNIDVLSAQSTSSFQQAFAAVEAEQLARIAADSAEASSRETLAAQLRGNYDGSDPSLLVSGLIYNERQVRVSAESAISSQVSTLSSTITNGLNSANAAISSEAQTRASADSALSTNFTTLSAKVDTKARTFYAAEPPTASAIGDLWFDTANDNRARRWDGDAWVDTTDTRITQTAAALVSEQTARADAVSALASSINTLQATASGFDTGISWNFDATIEDFSSPSGAVLSWSSGALQVVASNADPIVRSPTVSIDGSKNYLLRMRIKRVQGSAWDGKIYYSTAGHGESESFSKVISDGTALGEWRVLEWDMSALTAGGSDWTSSTILNFRIDLGASAQDQFLIDWIALGRVAPQGYSAAIASEATARASGDSALSTQITTLSSSVGDNAIALQTEATTRATETGDLFAQYTVKIDNNGHVSGFGLASTSGTAGPTSAFIVRADRFAIAGPNDTTDPLGTVAPTRLPFIVTTEQTTVNGKVYPAGTWIDTAFIANATITTAQIENLTADKVTAGSISAALGLTTGKLWGGVAISSNKNDGTFGNLLHPFASANFGTGFFLGNDGGTYKFYVGSPTQNMNWNGSALKVTGEINATSGSFRGITVYDTNDNVILSSSGVNAALLSVAASQVTGLGSLATQNNVSTGQVTGLGALATQNGVSTAQVSGLGALATQNNVSAGQVTGLGALATQNNVSTGQVTGLGGLATADSVFIGSTVKIWNGASYVTLNTSDFVNSLSKITSDNVSTFIASAAIGEAYIGNLNASKITAGTIASDRLDSGIITAKVANLDAAVITNGTLNSARIGTAAIDTLKIAGNAVTIPLTYENPYSYSATGTVLTYNFNMPSGGKVIIMWQGQTDSARYFFFRIYLNTAPGAGSPAGYSYVGYPNGDYEYDSESSSYYYVGPGAGSYTYSSGTPAVPDIGNTRTGGAFEDAPTAIGFGTALAGNNTVRIYWERDNGTLTYQRLIILGAQR